MADKNISQFREGSLGLFSKSEGGIPVNSSAARMPDLGLGVTGSLAASLAGVGVGVLDVEGVGDGGGGGGELMPADSASTRRSARRLEILAFARSSDRLPASVCVGGHNVKLRLIQ